MIQVFKPKLHTKEILYEIEQALDSGWIGLGPKTAQFETQLSQHVSSYTNFCALNSGTAALHLAVKNLKLRKGDFVLTTPNTFVSTNMALLYENLVPVFCDIDPRTGNVDLDSMRNIIERYPIKAIMVVHIGGYPCHMHFINQMARDKGVKVIEDCSHAFGSRYYDGRYFSSVLVGFTQNICTWSFHAVKTLPCGEGGAISTLDSDLCNEFKRQRWLGIDKDTISRSGKGYEHNYDVIEIGYKYHFNDILASIGIVQLKHFQKDLQARKMLAKEYLSIVNEKFHPNYKDIENSACHFIPFFFNNRHKVMEELISNEIYPTMHYRSNAEYGIFKDVAISPDGLTGMEEYWDKVLILPFHLHLSLSDIHKIASIVNKVGK